MKKSSLMLRVVAIFLIPCLGWSNAENFGFWISDFGFRSAIRDPRSKIQTCFARQALAPPSDAVGHSISGRSTKKVDEEVAELFRRPAADQSSELWEAAKRKDVESFVALARQTNVDPMAVIIPSFVASQVDESFVIAVQKKVGTLKYKDCVAEGVRFIDERRWNDARAIFNLATLVFLNNHDQNFTPEPDYWSLRYWDYDLRSWARETDTEAAFNWSAIDAAGSGIVVRKELRKTLLASLLLRYDFFRKRGPDISQAPAKVHGVIPHLEELDSDQLAILPQKLEAVPGQQGANVAHVMVNKITGKKYVVKARYGEAMMEKLAQRWFEHLGFSVVDVRFFSLEDMTGVLMGNVDHVESLAAYAANRLGIDGFLDPELISERLLPESFQRVLQNATLADIVIQNSDAHGGNVLVVVNEEGDLEPEQPIFIDRGLSFGLFMDIAAGNFQRETWQTDFGAPELKHRLKAQKVGEIPYHPPVSPEHVREIAKTIAATTEDDLLDILRLTLAEIKTLPLYNQLFGWLANFDGVETEAIVDEFCERFGGQWMRAVDSVRNIFELHEVVSPIGHAKKPAEGSPYSMVKRLAKFTIPVRSEILWRKGHPVSTIIPDILALLLLGEGGRPLVHIPNREEARGRAQWTVILSDEARACLQAVLALLKTLKSANPSRKDLMLLKPSIQEALKQTSDPKDSSRSHRAA